MQEMQSVRCTEATTEDFKSTITAVLGNPMERIVVDILGPLPRTARGNNHVTVIVEQFICRFGVLRQLHTDTGSKFDSEMFQHVCQLLDINKTRTTSRWPQNDGMVE